MPASRNSHSSSRRTTTTRQIVQTCNSSPVRAHNSSSAYTPHTPSRSYTSAPLGSPFSESTSHATLPPSSPLSTDSDASPSRQFCKKKASGHIPRPPNAFFIFRSEYWADLKRDGSRERDHKVISRMAANAWNGLPADQRKPWQDRADNERKRHAALYPEYKYTPGSRRRRGEKVVKSEEATSGMMLDCMLKGVEGSTLGSAVQSFEVGRDDQSISASSQQTLSNSPHLLASPLQDVSSPSSSSPDATPLPTPETLQISLWDGSLYNNANVAPAYDMNWMGSASFYSSVDVSSTTAPVLEPLQQCDEQPISNAALTELLSWFSNASSSQTCGSLVETAPMLGPHFDLSFPVTPESLDFLSSPHLDTPLSDSSSQSSYSSSLSNQSWMSDFPQIDPYSMSSVLDPFTFLQN